MIQIAVTRTGRVALYAFGQPVRCDQRRLRAWLEERVERPWPPLMELEREAARELMEWLRQ